MNELEMYVEEIDVELKKVSKKMGRKILLKKIKKYAVEVGIVVLWSTLVSSSVK